MPSLSNGCRLFASRAASLVKPGWVAPAQTCGLRPPRGANLRAQAFVGIAINETCVRQVSFAGKVRQAGLTFMGGMLCPLQGSGIVP